MSGTLAGAYSDSGSSAGESPRMRRRQLTRETDDDSEEEEVMQTPPAMNRDAPSLPPSYSTGAGGMAQMNSSSRLTPRHSREQVSAPPQQQMPRARSFPQAPPSVENASAIAVGKPGDAEQHSEDEGEYERLGALPGPSQTRARPGPRSRTSQQQQHPSQMQMPPPALPYAQRGNLAADDRLYGPPPSARYPHPPPSESAAGAAAGGFTPSVVGQQYYSTNASPAPTSQAGGGAGGGQVAGVYHYQYHRPSDAGVPGPPASTRAPYAPSSVGNRSGGRGGGGTSTVGGRQTRNQQVDTALQNIQASLAALHERLNRVENSRSWTSYLVGGGAASASAAGGRRPGGRRKALQSAYDAVANAVHDIAVLLGIRNAHTTGLANSALAPSYIAAQGGDVQRAKADLVSAPLRLAVALLNLFVRLALDAMSLTLLLSVLLLVVRRITGRGDPLIILRLIRRWTGIRPGVIVSGAAAAVTARANGQANSAAGNRGAIGN